MVEKRGRFGRKNGKGFYEYPEKGPKKLWQGISELQKKTLTADELERSARPLSRSRSIGCW